MINYKKIIKSRKFRMKILKMLDFLPDSVMLKIQYRLKMNQKLNLKNPKRFTEKLQWYKINYKDPIMADCADKYDVRNYIQNKGYGHILNELYGVYDSADAIDFDSLPNEFVMKDTIGGGSNSVFVCKDKNAIDRNELLQLATKWLSIKPEKVNCGREWIYCNKKHRIIIEKYIESKNETGLADWKFFCFNGQVIFVYWLGNRIIGKSVECGIFDADFNPLPVYRTDELRLSKPVQKPDNYNEMIKIAEKLSEDFPHVRVDLYDENNKIIFGELTFFGGSGYMKFVPDSFDYQIGEKFILPNVRGIEDDK